MTGKERILVVDDEEVMRDVLSTLLAAEGYAVDLAPATVSSNSRSRRPTSGDEDEYVKGMQLWN